jgi:hypothetical protein
MTVRSHDATASGWLARVGTVMERAYSERVRKMLSRHADRAAAASPCVSGLHTVELQQRADDKCQGHASMPI